MAKLIFRATLLAGAGIYLLPLTALVSTVTTTAGHRSAHQLPKFGPCHVRGSKLLFHDRRVAVVRGPPLPGFYGVPATEWKVYSCARGGRAHVLLPIGDVDTHTGQSIDHVTLAGVFGAFHVVAGSLATDIFDRVQIFDLATGRRVAQDVEATTYVRTLTALTLDESGTAAWTYSSTLDPATKNPKPPGQPPGAPVDLWGASATHAAARLDIGAIDPVSVTVRAMTVSWTNGGAPRQVELRGR